MPFYCKNIREEIKINNRTINEEVIEQFHAYLRREEKEPATQEKYLRDVRTFYFFVGKQEVTKNLVKAWKEKLMEEKYAVRSINSMLASLNSLLAF